MSSGPFLRFSLRDKRLFISRSTIEAMGNLHYVSFRWSMPTRALKLSGSFERSEHAVEMTRRSGSEYVFQRAQFIDGIALFMGWHKQFSYKVYSEPITEPDQVVFRLDNAVIVGCITINDQEGDNHA